MKSSFYLLKERQHYKLTVRSVSFSLGSAQWRESFLLFLIAERTLGGWAVHQAGAAGPATTTVLYSSSAHADTELETLLHPRSSHGASIPWLCTEASSEPPRFLEHSSHQCPTQREDLKLSTGRDKQKNVNLLFCCSGSEDLQHDGKDATECLQRLRAAHTSTDENQLKIMSKSAVFRPVSQ